MVLVVRGSESGVEMPEGAVRTACSLGQEQGAGWEETELQPLCLPATDFLPVGRNQHEYACPACLCCMEGPRAPKSMEL